MSDRPRDVSIFSPVFQGFTPALPGTIIRDEYTRSLFLWSMGNKGCGKGYTIVKKNPQTTPTATLFPDEAGRELGTRKKSDQPPDSGKQGVLTDGFGKGLLGAQKFG